MMLHASKSRVRAWALAAALGLVAACATPAQAPSPIPTSQAMTDPRRPAEDLALDQQRQGAAVLDISGIQPGWKVADLMQGAGYFTRLFVAKVGPTGKVYAWSPDAFMKAKPALYDDSLNVLQRAYPTQIVTMRSSFDDLKFPEKLDLIFTSQNYHDLHMKVFPAGLAAEMNKKVFDSLKPGGIYLVVDHVANADTADAPNTVHRIDPAVLRREIEAAGFKFDGESTALRKPADDHKLMVMNPAIRGKTDQIIYRFKKPG